MAYSVAAPPDAPDRELATFSALEPHLKSLVQAAFNIGWKHVEIAAAIMNFGVYETVQCKLGDAETARVLGEAIALREELLEGF